MYGKTYTQALLDLGSTTSLDVSKLSQTTLQSLASHVRVLQRNNVPIVAESFAERPADLLNSLRDRHGKLLSPQYKRQIAITIKRLFPEVVIDTRRYERHDAKPSRLSSDEFVDTLRRVVEKAGEFVGQSYKLDQILDLGLYDTCIAVLLTSSTSLRINEIMQLKMAHVELIEKDQPIAVKSKGSQQLRRVVRNSLLVRLFAAIQAQRPKVEASIKQTQHMTAMKHQIDRFEGGFIIISSISFMRKKLRELSAQVSSKSKSMGFNVFRRYVTSVLTEGGGHLIAQSLNNHSSVNTTLDHYNVVTSSSAERTYDKLDRLMNDLAPSVRRNEVAELRAEVEEDAATAVAVKRTHEGSPKLIRPTPVRPISRSGAQQPPRRDLKTAEAVTASLREGFEERGSAFRPTTQQRPSSSSVSVTAAEAPVEATIGLPPPPPPVAAPMDVVKTESVQRRPRMDTVIEEEEFHSAVDEDAVMANVSGATDFGDAESSGSTLERSYLRGHRSYETPGWTMDDRDLP